MALRDRIFISPEAQAVFEKGCPDCQQDEHFGVSIRIYRIAERGLSGTIVFHPDVQQRQEWGYDGEVVYIECALCEKMLYDE